MSQNAAPKATPTEISKPTRIFVDVYGDPDSHAHRSVVEAMTTEAPRAPAALPLEALAASLARAPAGLPVVDDDDRLIGWVDAAALAGAPPTATAGSLAERHVLAVLPSTSIGRAAALMVREGRDAIPVVAFDRRLEGVLSVRDLVRWVAADDGYLVDARAADHLRKR